MLEIVDRKLRPTPSTYPPPDASLPLDLSPSASFCLGTMNLRKSGEPVVSEIRIGSVSTFGRQAQAVCFLDLILDLVSGAALLAANWRNWEKLISNFKLFSRFSLARAT